MTCPCLGPCNYPQSCPCGWEGCGAELDVAGGCGSGGFCPQCGIELERDGTRHVCSKKNPACVARRARDPLLTWEERSLF